MMNISRAPKRLKLSFVAVVALYFLATTVGQTQTPVPAARAGGSGKAVVYAGNGNQLVHYDLDVATGMLTKRAAVTLLGPTSEGTVHPSRKYVYVVGSRASDKSNIIAAYRIDPTTGALTAHGPAVPVPTAASGYVAGVTTDMTGNFVLAGVTDPANITVYRLNADGTIGAEVKQKPGLDFAHHPHQIRMDPSNKTVVLPTRGDPARDTGGKEVPGAVKLFSFDNGVIANSQTIAPNGGFGYQVRHMDFHPSGKWDYFTLEVQQQIAVYDRKADGTLNPEAKFIKDTLKTGKSTLDCQNTACGQALSSVRVEPTGRFLYAANRGSAQKREGETRIYTGGENTIAVFSINQTTGEPTAIQHIDTQGIYPRTFALDPSGKILIATNTTELIVQEGGKERLVTPNLAVFRIGADGKLTFAGKYDTPRGGGGQGWVGITTLP